MKFYTNNPISIVTCITAVGNRVNEIVFVFPDPSNRGQGITEHYLKVLNSRYSASLKIANRFNIKISTIEWHAFRYNISEVKIVDAHLSRGQILHEHSVIMQPSDSYCALGFSQLRKFTRNKIALTNYWRRNINYDKKNTFYIFGNTRDKSNLSNIIHIDLELLNDLLKFVSTDFIHEIEMEYRINANSKYLLVLPPSTKNTGTDFTRVFFNEVNSLAAKDNLNVIIKPHRNDNTLEFPHEFRNVDSFNYNHTKHLFSEFFFLIPNIQKIVSVPSSSLAYADHSKLITYVPNNKRNFRRNFLDQICFLDSIGVDYFKI